MRVCGREKEIYFELFIRPFILNTLYNWVLNLFHSSSFFIPFSIQKFHKWTPLNSTVICYQTIHHSIPIHIQCQEEHMLKFLPNQTYSSRTLIRQEFQLVAEIPSYASFLTLLTYPGRGNFFNYLLLFEDFKNLECKICFIFVEITNREDLSFNHKKPKKSEITELEESEELLIQLCNITSVRDNNFI